VMVVPISIEYHGQRHKKPNVGNVSTDVNPPGVLLQTHNLRHLL
jgi:hypothetical protein